jgi:hypothetical protein
MEVTYFSDFHFRSPHSFHIAVFDNRELGINYEALHGVSFNVMTFVLSCEVCHLFKNYVRGGHTHTTLHFP